jgi:signal recognition particle subunit SRP54
VTPGPAGHARPAGSRSSTTSCRGARRRGQVPIDLDAPAGADPDGRPAGLGQDHHLSAKIAKRLKERTSKKVLMASLDDRRPAAMEQLRVLGEADRRRYAADRRGPVGRADRQARAARRQARRLRRRHPRHGRPPYRRRADGRNGAVKAATNPHEILLVADALTGQDAVNRRAPSTSASASPASC